MKREIEFRGKSGNTWHYGDAHTDYKGIVSTIIVPSACWRTETIETQCAGYFGVDPKTVGQYTCVKDINKKKIYEHDRVKCKGVKPLGTVVFDSGGFGVEFDEPIAEDWTSTALYCLINEEGLAECEVIGTVFDKESEK